MAQGAEVTRLIDVNQLADTWKVSPHTIRGWVASRRLNPTRICRRLLFTPTECERFLLTNGVAKRPMADRESALCGVSGS